MHIKFILAQIFQTAHVVRSYAECCALHASDIGYSSMCNFVMSKIIFTAVLFINKTRNAK